MDQVHVVRYKVLVEGRPQRAVARELGISRVTIRKYLDQAVPSRKAAAARPRPVLGTEDGCERFEALKGDRKDQYGIRINQGGG